MATAHAITPESGRMNTSNTPHWLKLVYPDTVSPDSPPEKPARAVNQEIRVPYERFCQELSPVLEMLLRTPGTLSVTGCSHADLARAAGPSHEPNCLVKLIVTPGEHPLFLKFEIPLALGILELLLGGTGEFRDEVRSLTLIETHMFQDVVEAFAKALESAFRGSVELGIRVEGVFPSLKSARWAGAPETVHTVDVSLELGSLRGRFTAIQSAELTTLLIGKELDAEPAQAQQRGVSLNDIGQAQVSLRVDLPLPEVPISDLLRLSPGQVLLLEKRLTDLLTCSVNGQAKFLGRIDRVGNHRGFRIETQS